MIDKAGTATPIAGNGKYGFSGDGSPATDATLAMPEVVRLDSAGAVYIADSLNNRVRKVAMTRPAGRASP